MLWVLVWFGEGCAFPQWLWPEALSVLPLVQCVGQSAGSSCLQADAGDDFSAWSGLPVQLQGRLRSLPEGNEIPEFFWSQVKNGAPLVALSDPRSNAPVFIPEGDGHYVFDLTVSADCMGHQDRVEVVVTHQGFVPDALELTMVADDLGPVVSIVQAPADPDRLYVALQAGQILVYDQGQVQLFLDIDPDGSVLWDCFECGLLNMVFDPDFATNGVFYVVFTGRVLPEEDPQNWDRQDFTRVVAFHTQDPNLADPQDRALILSVEQPFRNHHGGRLAFAPDGRALFGLGDSSPCGDPDNRAQNTDLLLGKLLRIELNGLAPYSVPADNPFVGLQGFRPEIWATGLRNPWGLSVDPLTGDVFVVDVGQADWEEINVVTWPSAGGQNFGWRHREGPQCFVPPRPECGPEPICGLPGVTDPIYSYGHQAGLCSVVGGYVYRGLRLPQLDGFYWYGDFCANQLMSLRLEDDQWVPRTHPIFLGQVPFAGNLTCFGEGENGDLYLGTLNGVFRIQNIRP